MDISAEAVRFDDDSMWVELSDGRTIGVPYAWFPRLLSATSKQREAVEIGRFGLHWEEIDEDISIAGLLAGRRDQTLKPRLGDVFEAKRGTNVVYVAARPKGRRAGEPIEDYVVEDHANRVLKTFRTQHEAIAWAKMKGHHPLVARVRHLNNNKNADRWRSA
jgi:Protein of unknown function (DUF2442)